MRTNLATRRSGLRRRGAAALVCLGLLIALTACGGGGTASSDAGGDAAMPVESPVAGEIAPETGAGGGVDESGARVAQDDLVQGQPDQASTGQTGITERAVISTGNVALRTDDVGEARFDVQKVVDKHRGQVTDEQTQTDEKGELWTSRVVIRVPADDFDAAMGEFGAVADLVESSRHSEDVTTQVIDVEVRIRAQEKSLERIEVLLARAQSIRDIVAIEAQLTRRQADLDSLKSQQAWLADQTSQSTITLSIERSAKDKPDDDESGFLDGLKSGWAALAGFGAALATFLGAALPFLVLVLVLGVPIAWAVRRLLRRGRRPAATPPDPDPTTAGG